MEKKYWDFHPKPSRHTDGKSATSKKKGQELEKRCELGLTHIAFFSDFPHHSSSTAVSNGKAKNGNASIASPTALTLTSSNLKPPKTSATAAAVTSSPHTDAIELAPPPTYSRDFDQNSVIEVCEEVEEDIGCSEDLTSEMLIVEAPKKICKNGKKEFTKGRIRYVGSLESGFSIFIRIC